MIEIMAGLEITEGKYISTNLNLMDLQMCDLANVMFKK